MDEVRVLTADDGAPVLGMTSANHELFILRHRNAECQVEVYSTANFTFRRRFPVPGLRQHGIQDMKAKRWPSADNTVKPCIADSAGPCVHMVVIVGEESCCSVDKWSLSYKPFGLSTKDISVDNTHCFTSLLVACKCGSLPGTAVVVELYNGKKLQETVLDVWVSSLWHAIPVRGDYLICYEGLWCARSEKISRVKVQAERGSVSSSYGDGWLTSEKDLLRGAHQMAVDEDGFVFVADSENNRVVLLNPSLQFVRYIATKNRPKWLHVDDESHRLFVGHDSNAVSILQLYD